MRAGNGQTDACARTSPHKTCPRASSRKSLGVVEGDGSEEGREGPYVSRIADEAWSTTAPTDAICEGEDLRRCWPVVGVGNELVVDEFEGLCDQT